MSVPSTPLMRVAVLASGRGSNFAALLQASQSGQLPITIVGAFSDRSKAGVLERARAAGLYAKAIVPRDFDDRAAHESALFAAIDAVQPDLIVCAGYMRILSAASVRPRSHMMINIHPSLLPRHRGLHTHQRAIDAGDREHGASVHFVTAELDGGPVIAQVRVPVLPDDSSELLSERVLAREHSLLCATVNWLATSRVVMRDDRVHLDDLALTTPLQLDACGVLHLIQEKSEVFL